VLSIVDMGQKDLEKARTEQREKDEQEIEQL
jgi:hypothetical protein